MTEPRPLGGCAGTQRAYLRSACLKPQLALGLRWREERRRSGQRRVRNRRDRRGTCAQHGLRGLQGHARARDDALGPALAKFDKRQTGLD